MKFLVFIILFVCYYKSCLFSCTVFFATNGIYVLGGNNEDWSDPNTKFWLIPANNGNYGWIKFGFTNGYPQGGMNDQGVFWDATTCPYLEMPYSENHKVKFNGSLMQKVMEECKSINEAILIFKNYYCDDLYRAQYLIGDRFGNSVIVEGDSIISNNNSYQVMTNFYHSHPELGGYPCRRYEIANETLKNSGGISELSFGHILAATHQKGKYPTQYSQIYNLKEGRIYLFHYHNYEEFINIKLIDELKYGYRDFKLPFLFSNIEIISPAANQIINSLSIKFYWRGNKTSRYELLYSTDSTFVDHKVASVSFKKHANTFIPIISSLLIGIFLLIGIKGKFNKKTLIIGEIVTLLMILSCKDEVVAPQENNTIEFQQTFNNLESNKTYYWKIIAYPDGELGFNSETLVHSFKTEY